MEGSTSNGWKMFSDSLKDAVKVQCKICSIKILLTGLRKHTRSKHMMTIAEYKRKYGQPEIIRMVRHECKLCGESLMLDSEHIVRHLSRNHNTVSYKGYINTLEVDNNDRIDRVGRSQKVVPVKENGQLGKTSEVGSDCDTKAALLSLQRTRTSWTWV